MTRDVIGLVPAAGEAKRMGMLPCSKEILPIGIRDGERGRCVKVASHYLMERMRHAGVSRIYVILRKGKEDIPRFLGDGEDLGVRVGYLYTDLRPGTSFTLDRAYPVVRGAQVVLGFPDILFEPEDAFVRLLEKQRTTKADVVLGLFPTRQPERMDMVALDERGRVRDIDIKPLRTDLEFSWIIATWNRVFTEFLHVFLERVRERDPNPGVRQEYHVGVAFQAALHADLRVESVVFREGKCLDIGTPEDYLAAVCQGGNPHLTFSSRKT